MYVDTNTAAEHLGTTVRHIRELVYRRQIPYYKVGRLVRFKPSELDEWMAKRRVSPGSS